MRIFYTMLLVLFLGNLAYSQNDRLYTMFVFNKLQYNPGYAGSNEALTIGAHYRHQWQGIIGAPRTITAFAHTPFAHNRSGLGLSVISDEIGIFNSTFANLSYAYRIALKNDTKLSVGLSVQMDYTRFDWAKADLIDNFDAVIPFGEPSSSTFNMGMGVYYTGPKFYLGASVPQFMRNALTSEALQGFGRVNDFRTYYFMGGTVFKLGGSTYLRPSVLISYVNNAPISVDLNISLLFLESFWVGASYRLGDSVDAFVQFPVAKQLRLAVGMDYALSELSYFTKGSFEVMLEYTFKTAGDKINNIRFF